MSSNMASKHIAWLIAIFNFEIKALPNDLKCEKCKSVLKDAHQVVCGCRFCRTCIDDVMANGARFCSGDSRDCGKTLLSSACRDYMANKSIMRLIVKCPQRGCLHECPLAHMEDHLRVCAKKTVRCPICEVGCQHDAEEINIHLQNENISHNATLINMVVNINREIEMQKQSDEARKSEIEMLKMEMLHKDEQMRTIVDEMRHVQNENKLTQNENRSIKEENKSIKEELKLIGDLNKSFKNQIKTIQREKEVLSSRVNHLSEKLDREIYKRIESDKLDTSRINTVTRTIESYRDSLETEVESVKDYILSINSDIKSVKSDIDSMKSHVLSSQVALDQEQVDAGRDELLIDLPIGKRSLVRTSACFTGVRHPYTYQVAAANSVISGTLCIYLRILPGPSDSILEWPFKGTVTVTVAHRDKSDVCSRQTRQCQVEKPPVNKYSKTDRFEFRHSELTMSSLDLDRGARVSCQIVLGADP